MPPVKLKDLKNALIGNTNTNNKKIFRKFAPFLENTSRIYLRKFLSQIRNFWENIVCKNFFPLPSFVLSYFGGGLRYMK